MGKHKFSVKNFQRILSPENSTRIVIVLFSALLLYLFPVLADNVNTNLLGVVQDISGETDADTNVVLIKITEEDIENLGGWPLKRSYYALIIKTLSEFNPRAIGLGAAAGLPIGAGADGAVVPGKSILGGSGASERIWAVGARAGRLNRPKKGTGTVGKCSHHFRTVLSTEPVPFFGLHSSDREAG